MALPRKRVSSVCEMDKRRASEVRMEATVAHNKEVFKTTRLALWEQSTDLTIAKKSRERRVKELSAQRMGLLEERRRKLKELYESEAAMWRDAMQRPLETTESRKLRLEKRALELKEAREKERLEFVESCYARQRRLASDDVRTRDSKALSDLVAFERQEQAKNRASEKKNSEEMKKQEMDEWLQRLALVDEDEALKRFTEENSVKNLKDALSAQVKDSDRRKAEAFQKKMTEDNEELENLRNAIHEDRQNILKQRQDAKQRGKDIREQNSETALINGQKAEEDKRRDLVLLNYALHLEDLANKQDEAKLHHEEVVSQRYKSYLDGLAKKQATDQTRLDAERLVLENRIWEAKGAEEQRQHDAREFLRAQVHQGRQEQLALQKSEAIRERQDRLKEIETIAAYQKHLDATDDQMTQLRRQVNVANLEAIRHQIYEKRDKKKQEEQALFLEAKMQQATERQHATMAASQGGFANLHHPLQSTNWYT